MTPDPPPGPSASDTEELLRKLDALLSRHRPRPGDEDPPEQAIPTLTDVVAALSASWADDDIPTLTEEAVPPAPAPPDGERRAAPAAIDGVRPPAGHAEDEAPSPDADEGRGAGARHAAAAPRRAAGEAGGGRARAAGAARGAGTGVDCPRRRSRRRGVGG